MSRQVGQSLRTTYPPPPPGYTFSGLCPRPAQAPPGRQEATEHPGGGGGRPLVTCSLGPRVATFRPRCRRPAALAGAGCPGGRAPARCQSGFGSPPAPGSVRPQVPPHPARARANKGSAVPFRRTENWRRCRSCSTRMGPPCSSALGGVACAIARADTGDRGPQ